MSTFNGLIGNYAVLSHFLILSDLRVFCANLWNPKSALVLVCTLFACLAEMQKAASMASVLVLIFPPAVLIFEHPAQIVIN